MTFIVLCNGNSAYEVVVGPSAIGYTLMFFAIYYIFKSLFLSFYTICNDMYIIYLFYYSYTDG